MKVSPCARAFASAVSGVACTMAEGHSLVDVHSYLKSRGLSGFTHDTQPTCPHGENAPSTRGLSEINALTSGRSPTSSPPAAALSPHQPPSQHAPRLLPGGSVQ